MNPWQWYMIGLCGAVTLSIFVVTASGALHPIWNLLIPVALYLSYRRYRKQSIGTFGATVLGLGGFGVGAAAIVQLPGSMVYWLSLRRKPSWSWYLLDSQNFCRKRGP